MHELKLKNKHNQAISFRNIYIYNKTIFQKMEGTATYKIHAIGYLLGKCKGENKDLAQAIEQYQKISNS